MINDSFSPLFCITTIIIITDSRHGCSMAFCFHFFFFSSVERGALWGGGVILFMFIRT